MNIVFILVLTCIFTYCKGQKIKVNLDISTENCHCDGYEGGGHADGPRPFRVVCTKVSSSSSNRGNQENAQTCSPNKGNQKNTMNKGESSKKTENQKNRDNCSKTKGNKKDKEDCSKNKENQECKGDVSKETQNDCTYTGNPHRCKAYNNDNQEKFYHELLAAIAPHQCRNINEANAPCPQGPFNTKKTCDEIEYNLVNS